jgi:hypothetical protein
MKSKNASPLKDIKDITKSLSERFYSAFNNGSRFFNQLYDAVRLAVPTQDGLNILYEYNDSGKYLEYYAGNSAPQMAADKRASDMHSLLLPPGRRWGDVFTDGEYNDDESETMFEIMQDSNIHSIAHTVFLDLTIGTAGIWIDSPSQETPLSFSALTGVAILPEFDGKLTPENVWFKKAIGGSQLSEYGINIDDYSSNNDMVFLTCGFIKNRDNNGCALYDIKNSDRYEWLYIEVIKDRWDAPIIMEARKYKQLHIINDTMRAGESRGRGVVLKMLKDIQRLSEATESYNSQTQFQLAPPILANENIGNYNFSNLSNAVLPASLTEEGVPLLQPMKWQIELQEGRAYMESLENKINISFNVLPLGEVGNTPVRTATEVAGRLADAQRQSLTDISRVVHDFEGVFRAVLLMLKDRGIVGKGAHKITFRNPTLDAENQNQLNNLATYRELSSQLLTPQYFLLSNNPDSIDSYLKSKLNIPRGLASTPAERQAAIGQIRQASQEQPQQQSPSSSPQALDPQQFGQQTNIRGFGV